MRQIPNATSSGQATIEVLAGVPALLLGALIALQLLVTGYSQHLADGAAEAGALALSAGLPVEPAARGALPGWARDAVSVAAEGGRVRVWVRPPAPLAPVAEALEVTSSAWSAPPGGGDG